MIIRIISKMMRMFNIVIYLILMYIDNNNCCYICKKNNNLNLCFGESYKLEYNIICAECEFFYLYSYNITNVISKNYKDLEKIIDNYNNNDINIKINHEIEYFEKMLDH